MSLDLFKFGLLHIGNTIWLNPTCEIVAPPPGSVTY